MYLGCKNHTKQRNITVFDSMPNTKIPAIENNPTTTSQTHLKDTTSVKADCVIFLTPDSIRFESHKSEEGIYEVDSDFGFWLRNAIDSMKQDKSLKKVRSYVTQKRFLEIKGCQNCSEIIDRDTIDYGLILISRKKGIKINPGLSAGNYIYVIRDYFK